MPGPGKLITTAIRNRISGHLGKYVWMEKNHRAAVKADPFSKLTETPEGINKHR